LWLGQVFFSKALRTTSRPVSPRSFLAWLAPLMG